MENFYLTALIKEIAPKLLGKSLRRILLIGSDLYLDFRLAGDVCLRIVFDEQTSGLFLDRPISSASNEAHPFVTLVKKELAETKLESILKPDLDRVVILQFVSTNLTARQNLVLSFAGRHANAYLTDADLFIDAHLKPKGKFRSGDRFTYLTAEWDFEPVKESVSTLATKEEILEIFFNPRTSPYSPLLRQEFLFRSLTASPAEAMVSLFESLAAIPVPLLYHNFPLESIDSPLLQLSFALNIPSHIYLSHFPLHYAESQNLTAEISPSLSQAAQTYHHVLARAAFLKNEFASVKKLIRDAVKKLAGLNHALETEREKYADPERFKRFGDLLLANLTIAKIADNKATVIDYFDENQPEIVIEIAEGKTLQQAAAAYFSLYQKARRAGNLILEREVATKKQLRRLQNLTTALTEEITVESLGDIRRQSELVLGIKKKAEPQRGSIKKREKRKPIGRWFRASSGHEIVVGKNDKENDAITFHLARSQDVWLHAADYPGSHVIIRNPNRAEVPLKIIQEAAELAAFHSQAKGQKKVAVHYTQRKFVSKPPRAKPGLVRLSAFKTITVEPRANLEQIGAAT